VKEHAFTSLLVLAGAIVIGPAFAVRLRLPAAVVLILIGIAVGPTGLAWVDGATPAVAIVSELGFLVLMFMAGMEIDFASLRRAGMRALATPALTVAGVFVAAIAVGFALGFPAVSVLVLSATSVGMPLAVLQESGRLPTPLGRHLILTASLGEFVSILAITGFEVFAHDGDAFERVFRLTKVVVLFVLCAMMIRWARALVWWHPGPFGRLVHHHDVAELGVRTGMLLMLAFVVLAELFGVEAILGAFVGGALVGFVLHEKHALEAKIGALGQGLFIPIFFVVVGVRFDPRLIDLPALKDAALFVALAVVVKVLPTVVFAGRELGLRDRLAAGMLLAAPLTLVVAIAAIGRQLGVVDERQEASFVLIALALSVLFPIGFRAITGGAAKGAGGAAEGAGGAAKGAGGAATGEPA
jgi:Kef-type K+ transport system membrane component KefB